MPETLFPLPEAIAQPAEIGLGKPRLERANRQQVSMRYAALDDLLPEEHRARLVWAMVESYDLSRFYGRIEAVEGGTVDGASGKFPMMQGIWVLTIV
jgi:hypothetical protein